MTAKRTVNGRKSWKVKHYEHSKEFDQKHRVLVVEIKDGRPKRMGMALSGQVMLPMAIEYGSYLPLYGRRVPHMTGCE